MSTTSENRVTPRDVARILFRHWRKISLIFCSVIGLALLAIALYPRTYLSESKLVIRIGRESVGLDPTATTGETVMLQKTQDEEVNSAVNILTSREVLEQVVKKIGAERILDDTSSDASSDAVTDDSTIRSVATWISDTLVSLRLSDPGTKMDRAVRRLEKTTNVAATKLSNVISVSYKAASPALAHDVVDALTSVFLQEHARLNRTDGSLKFFAAQAEMLLKDLTAAQVKLRDRKNAYQLTSGQSRRSIVEQTKDAMRQKVYDLQTQENELMSRYTDDYPPLEVVRRQRELAEKALVELPQEITAAGESGSEDAKKAAADRLRTKANPAVLQAAKPSTEQQGRLSSDLETLNDQELELAQLEREVKLLEGKYAMHVQKLEEARVNDALSGEGITNVKVAQPASLVYKPVSPKKALLLAGAFMVALVGSIGSAFAAESVDQTLRTTGQVERQLGLPVLASIRRRKRGQKRRRPTTTESNGSHAADTDSSRVRASRFGGYQGLLTTMRSNGSNGARRSKSVAIVGCETSKERSRVAGNLAIEAASCGTEPVLLIDADPRRRRVSKRFHLNGAPGWRDVLAGSAAAMSCVQQSTLGNLAVMGPGGTNGLNPTVGASANAAAQLDGIKSNYGFVIVDLPATGELESLPAATEWIDEAVLVVEAEHTRIQAAQRTMEQLHRAGVEVAGIILTNRRDYIPRWLYQRL
jgi:polysaccharide biosynthesis transport protein